MDGTRYLNRKNTEDRKPADIVKLWPSQAVESRPYCSGTTLPVDVWRKILQTLCSDIETRSTDVRTVSVVARDICNVSQVSKVLWTASYDALHDLSSLCQMQVRRHPLDSFNRKGQGDPESNIVKPSWSAFLRQPFHEESSRDQTEEIIDMAMACEIGYFFCHPSPICLDRSALVLGIFNFLHLTRPSNVPFQLLYAVAQERNRQNFQGMHFNWESWCMQSVRNSPEKAFSPAFSFSDFKFRRLLIHLGIKSRKDFVQATSTPNQRAQLLDQLVGISTEEYSEKLKTNALQCVLSLFLQGQRWPIPFFPFFQGDSIKQATGTSPGLLCIQNLQLIGLKIFGHSDC